jgi:CubicO group peptidase (beta-lactamase class C family)
VSIPQADAWSRLPSTHESILAGLADGLHLGAQLYVSLQGEAVANAALGERRPGEPLRRDDLMLWLSATKPIAAMGIATLWERGELALDDPVVRFIPEFSAHGKEGITVRHLLTHTAGIRLLDLGWPRQSWDEIVARIAAMRPEPHWNPGHKAGYHTASSWFILGEILVRLSGANFAAFVREEIFEPLGMTDSWIGMSPASYAAYRAADRIAPLWRLERTPATQDGTEERSVETSNPGGNGRGPMSELGRFYEALLAHGTLGGRTLWRPQTVEAMTARHRVGMLDHTFQHPLDWGLGFIINSSQYGADTVPYGYGHRASPRTFGHSGYRSSVGFADPEFGLVVALAFNGTPDNAAHERRVRAVLDAIYDDLGLGWESAGPAAEVSPANG